MGVFTFMLHKSSGEWTTKQHNSDIEESSSDTFEIQWKLVKAVCVVESSDAVQSSFSIVTPSSAIFQILFLDLV
ncbi:60S acidic ribosomal protein [Arachis hypogaea]|nr:60S acidic ribosomal protein [Arachis hypogaea]